MSLTDNLIKAAFSKLQSFITGFKDFLKKPDVLVALAAASFVILNTLLPQLKRMAEKKLSANINSNSDKALSQIQNPQNISEDDVNNYVKNNRGLQNFLDYAGRNLDNSVISDMILACENPNYYPDQINVMLGALSSTNISGNDYINIAQQQSDFDSRTDSRINLSNLSNIFSKISGTIPWVFMTYYIIIKIKEFLTQNDHPSVYRGKYLQGVIRILGSILKESLRGEGAAIKNSGVVIKALGKEEIDQANQLLSILKSLDSVIVGTLMASFIYLQNRKIGQQKSLETFNEISLSQSCILPETPISDFNSSAKTSPLRDVSLNGFNCPIDIDDAIYPHIPIEDKISLLSCETQIDQDGSINSGTGFELATKALYENRSSKSFDIKVKTNELVDSFKLLAIFDGKEKIYSSVVGTVGHIENNKIFINDISDPTVTLLDTLIQKNQDNFKTLNNIKFFLKDFYVESSYPSMLKASPLIDGSINARQYLNLVYRTGGVRAHWDGAMDSKNNQNNQYNSDVQTIAGSQNVEAKATNNQLNLIKEELDIKESDLFKAYKADVNTGINRSAVTLPFSNEYNLLEYYFNLAAYLSSYYDQNDIVTGLLTIIQGFLQNRYFIEQYSLEQLKGRINNSCVKLIGVNLPFQATPNFYDILKTKYDTTLPSNNKKTKSVEDYLKTLGSKNTNLSETDKTSIINTILFLFNFSLQIQNLVLKAFAPKTNKYLATKNEATIIDGYFNNLWKQYNQLPIDIDSIYAQMDTISKSLQTYSIVSINDEFYRYYGIGPDRTCPIPEEDNPYLSPYSKYGFGDIAYWLKYCSFATLASVANPATGWSTGFPPPIGPIPFPTVYIPIKAFPTPWGFIVIGLTITGIFPFPWALFVNYSSEHHVPFADPASIIKNEIFALKKELSDGLKSLKNDVIKSYMIKTKQDITDVINQISGLTNQIRLHNLDKPKRNRTIPATQDIPAYEEKLSQWTILGASLNEELLAAKIRRFQLETKYKILKDAFDGNAVQGNEDPKIKSIQASEKSIDNNFAKLDSLTASIDPMIAGLPVATKPQTANFALTAKNPKPVIKMSSKDISKTIDNGVLDNISKKYELKNSDLMSSNYSSILSNSITNYSSYKNSLKNNMSLIITQDCFPKYENLQASNLPWVSFLYQEWVPTGATTYGFPGFPPFPVG